MTTGRPFICEQLKRAIAQSGPEPTATVALRSALQLAEALADHPSPAVRAQALEVALHALAHARGTQ